MLFSNTSLEMKSFSQLFQNQVSPNLRKIDFSSNPKLKFDSYKLLAALLSNELKELKYLDLENNIMGDQSACEIMKVVETHNGLSYLNMSKNEITDKSGQSIGEMIKQNNKLTSLFLHWNKIGQKASIAIADGLIKNDTLLVLDLSFNAMMSYKSQFESKEE